VKAIAQLFLWLLSFFGTDCIVVGAIMIYEAITTPRGQGNVEPWWLGLALCAFGASLTFITVVLLLKLDKPDQR